MQKLTVRQKKFCDEYVACGNATQAAIKAGYSKKTAKQIGSDNLSKVYLKSYIDEKLKVLEDKKIAKADEILQYLTSCIRGEINEEVVVVVGTGDGTSSSEIVEKQISIVERTKAAHLLGKRYRLFSDKVEIEGAIPIVIKDDLSDDDV